MNNTNGLLALVSLGPGDLSHLTAAARVTLESANVVIGYQFYIDLIRPILRPDQEVIVSPIGHEVKRAEQAIDMAAIRRVAMVSSGDIGIYAMAGPIFEVLRQRDWDGSHPEVMVLPGVSAIQAAAAKLGAPIAHDFCTISLSNLLTPWPIIERRLLAAAWGDFVIGFYNPRSQRRDWQLDRAIEILSPHRPPETPVAVVRNVTRPDEAITLMTLVELDPAQVDMFTLVVVGNSQSHIISGHMATPRGYTKTPPVKPTRSSSTGKTAVYPITLAGMTGRLAVIVGGGPVGTRKVKGALAADMQVRVISPDATPTLTEWAEAGRITWEQRLYQAGDLVGATLAFAATNQREVNAAVAEEAQLMQILCNIADAPDEGDFHVPAVHRQPDTVVAVSTRGEKPSRARRVRDQIAEWMKDDAKK